MADLFFQLDERDRKDALEVAASKLGRPAHLLDKDIWVVWALRTLFEAPIGEHLVFKGGTSLSKAYHAIERFSEDVDVTYDIRAIAPELAGDSENPIPPNRSQRNRWTKVVRGRLPDWIEGTVLPLIADRLEEENLGGSVSRNGDSVSIDYTAMSAGTGYVRPRVLLEFGARSTGEPAETRQVTCDAAPAVGEIEFPSANPRVMRAERTFWEKATAIHVYCERGQFRGADRYARHWYDLVCLDNVGIAATAFADRSLAMNVAEHKSWFFPEHDANGHVIDYRAAVGGGLRLVPDGDPLAALRIDYQKMVDDRLLFDEPTSFEVLIAHCADLEKRANS